MPEAMRSAVLDHGHLPVGNGHALYWQRWGNAGGVPVVFLHGGPGAGFHDSHKALFDPERHHVLFFDQRGCGRSTPYGSLEHNTTADLVEDIARLMDHVGFGTAHIAGGSWGSALTLAFAIARPERVRSLLVWSVYLARQSENDWVNEGRPRPFFPDEWDRFISQVPVDRRDSGDSVMRFYAEKFDSPDPVEAMEFAVEWTLWESCLLSIAYDSATVEDEVRSGENTLATAKLEAHYFLNGCFLPENDLLTSLDRIRHLSCQVVQGRFDMCTPPESAHELRDAYGSNLTLHVVNAGHLRSDPALREALQVATARLS
jgi:proline iminopeptidase